MAWALLALGCTSAAPAPQGPAHYPPPAHEVRGSSAQVELGRRLFYDRRLSVDNNRSCGLCHEQAKAFTDGFVRSVGTEGDVHPHNAPSLVNVAWRPTLGWSNPEATSLLDHALGPLFAHDPIVEMGLEEDALLARLEAPPSYQGAFALAFPGAPEPSIEHVLVALAAFQATLVGGGAPIDQVALGHPLEAAAARGLALFESDRLGCRSCHGGPLFDRPLDDDGVPSEAPGYACTGLYNLDGAYPDHSRDLSWYTGDPADRGKVRTPSLHNVTRTGPWGHDGSYQSLDDVLDAYARGGRLVQSGPNASDGALHPNLDPRIQPFDLSDGERADLHAFFEALADPTLATREELADPFCRDEATDPPDCLPSYPLVAGEADPPARRHRHVDPVRQP